MTYNDPFNNNPYEQPQQPMQPQQPQQVAQYSQNTQPQYAQSQQTQYAQPQQIQYNPNQYTQQQYSPNYNGNQEHYNTMAIIGFVCSFFISIVGLILSLLALSQIKKTGEKGYGLALAGAIISGVSMLLVFLMVITGCGIMGIVGSNASTYGAALLTF